MLTCSGKNFTLDPGIHIFSECLECSGGSLTPSSLPHLFPNSATSQKVLQMMTPHPEMLETTPTWHLNCPPPPLQKTDMVFQSSFWSPLWGTGKASGNVLSIKPGFSLIQFDPVRHVLWRWFKRLSFLGPDNIRATAGLPPGQP